MSQKYRVIIAVIGVLLGLFMAWYFFNILVYIITAGVISLIGQPLVEMLSKVRIRNIALPKSIAALITIIVLLGILTGLIFLFIPAISKQAAMLSKIDIDEVVTYFAGVINRMQAVLLSYDVIGDEGTLQSILERQVSSVINISDVSNIVEKMLLASTTLFVGLFSVLFLSFFFLRDRQLLRNGILLFTPDRFQGEVKNVMHKTKILLSRYFIGLIGELLIMMFLISIGLALFGIKNAVFIGFIGGLMNVIPYLGPIIGTIIGFVLGVTGDLSVGLYDNAFNTAMIVVFVFVATQLVDNWILQPLIYSRSVNAHPIEIFIVILMAGSLAGIPGMILAVPAYTVLRIVAKEFLGGFKLVDKLTENI
jgi:predicted PurR-regulated permease PerM